MPATESSPLLDVTQLPSEAPPRPDHDHEARSRAIMHRARIALLPLLLIAIVGIVFVFARPLNVFSSSSTTIRTGDSSSPDPSLALSDGEIMTSRPPFIETHHVLPPHLVNRSRFPGAIPTNAFWTNLLVGDSHGFNVGAGEITLSPYTVRCLPKRLEISYGDSRRVATPYNVTEYFNVDMSLTGYSQKTTNSMLLGDGNSTAREVLSFDPLTVRVQYQFEASTTQYMDALLVRGAPYVTVEYHNIMPVLELNATVLAINGDPVENVEGMTGKVRQWTAKRFRFDIQVYGAPNGTATQRWLLYFAEPRTLQLQFANEKDYRSYNLRGELTIPTNVRFVDTDMYTGPARLAIVPDLARDDDAEEVLDQYAEVYPIASAVDTTVTNNTALISFCWTPKAMVGQLPLARLLMLADPHHINSFSLTHQRDGSFKELERLGHRTIKSMMTPIVANCWTLEEELPNVGFGTETKPAMSLDQIKVIKIALWKDAEYTPKAKDPYFFGKEIARQARLVLIADTLGGMDAVKGILLDHLEQWTEPWLRGVNEDPFVYERSWGGICSKHGLSGLFWMTDFGNGWYNDHHFHYGYLLYSLAVLAKYRPAFAHQHRAAIFAIARDIASLDADDEFFPLTRHFSWFDGHSFASGIYTLEGGKSQESVSEAINAYYGIYLLGLAMHIPRIEQIGHILTTLESRAARTYWQMTSDSNIYEPIYAQNKMTGQVGCTKVSYTTWFGGFVGDSPIGEHMHLINMIPFTPITPTFLSREYVAEEYPVLAQQAFDRKEDPIDKRWKGYAYLDLAIIDSAEAWKQIEAMDFFDDGSSRTNALFWIASQRA